MTTDAPLIWPTTPLQQGLVALAELGRGPDAAGAGPRVDYLGQSVVELSGAADVDTLSEAVAAVTTDLPHLHAGFVMDDDVAPVQFIEALDPIIEVHRPSGPTGCVESVLAWQRTLAWELDAPPLVRWDIVLDADDRPSALVIAAHHVVLDGWSMPLLVAQVARHYARLVGARSDLPEVRGSYADHLRRLARADAEAARRFWSGHLEQLEASAPTWLRPSVDPRRTAHHRVAVEPVDPARLAERGLTPAALARTCWGLALDAVAGTTGTPFAVAVTTRDASTADADALIGLTTDAVLVAETPTPSDTVLSAAVTANDRWTASLPHHHVGLRGIHAALRSPESASSLLAVETTASTTRFVGGPVTFTLTRVEDDTHYPLAAVLVVGSHGSQAPWTLDITYDASAVEAATARRHADAFVAFLQATASDTAIGAIDVVGPDDDALLLDAESRPEPHHGPAASASAPHRDPGPGGETAHPPLLPDAFAATCARFPQRTALVDGGPEGRREEWTFAQLAAQVREARDELLGLLPARGDHPRVVAVTLPRSARLVVTLLAVLDAGGAALVVDPALPPARREAILTDVGAALAVTAEGIDVRHDLARGATARRCVPADVASVVLTSGSTGLPKPVAVSHLALAHLLRHHRDELHPDAETTPRHVAHAAAFHFDAHWDALLAMFAGHTVHVLAEVLFLDPYALADYAAAQSIDYLDLTPTVWSELLAADAFTRLPRVCVLGGEALPARLWTRLRDLTAGTECVALNLYGPTEATVDAAWASVADHPTPVVGRPLGMTGLLVLDDHLRRVPPGTPGELYLTGPQLAHGYLGRPALTAQRFVANPYPRRDDAGAVRPGDERIYRTGDIARWTEDGLLVLGGRADGQLSLAGRRVEPGEIEAVLTEHDRVREAVVIAHDSVSGRGRLVGYVVAEAGTTDAGALVDDLLDACRAGLPAALVPADLVVLDAWPLTPNGKLDRSALPSPGARSAGAGLPTSGSNDARTGLADVRACLAEVLRMPIDEIGDETDFFTLGGDSIAAIQVCSRLRRRGWAIRAGQVLAARTTAAIAAAAEPLPAASDPALGDPAARHDVDTDREAGEPDDPFGLLTPQQRAELLGHLARAVPGARLERVLPLTPTQVGIYVDAHRLHPDPCRTTLTLRLDLPPAQQQATPGSGPTCGDDVDAAVAAWFARHESLRVAVWQADLPRPIAVVLDHLDVPHRHLDATHLDDAGVAALLERVRRDELERDLSFDAGRLAGYTWVRTGATTSYLVVSMHHLLADGWSTPVLADELREHLAGSGDDSRDAVFADYLRWWESQDRESAQEVWRAEFAGVAAPTLLGRGESLDGLGGSTRERRIATVDLDGAVFDPLLAQGVTAAAVCQAAWARLLADLTGRDDVAYLLASSGRPEHLDGIETAVGMFVTTRPVRVSTRAAGGGPASPGELARAVTASLERTQTAAHLGLGQIGRLLGTVADTLVVVENYPRRNGPPPTGGVRSPRVTMVQGSDATTFPVTATVTLGARPALEVEVDPAQCDADAQWLAAAWHDALAASADAYGSGARAQGHAAAPAAARPRLVPLALDGESGPGLLAVDTPPATGEDDRCEEVARVMAQVLDVTTLPATTSFFEAGGDSILAVRLVGALRGRGLRVGIADVFSAPTPQALAPRATAEHPTSTGESAGLQLTPALAWYRDMVRRGGSGRGFQQVREILLPVDTRITAIGTAAQRLLERHDALRLRIGLETADIVTAPPARLAVFAADALHRELRRIGAEIDPATGDLVRWIVVPEADAVRLVVLAHHVAVDAVSWGILTDDLRALLAGAGLPPAPSFAAWTRTQARDDVLAAAAPAASRWVQTLTPATPLIGSDPTPGGDLGLVGAARELEMRLEADVTARLLAAVESGWRMETLLLAALTAGRDADLVVELEGHGRPIDVRGTDPRADDPGAGAVGWFTATWPVRLPAGVAHDAESAPVSTAAHTPVGPAWEWAPSLLRRHLTRTAQALEASRVDGPDYGLLRHLHPDHRTQLADAERRCPPQVLVNYLGGSVASHESDPAALEEELGLHADLPVSHPLELNAHLVPTGEHGSELVARWQVAAPAVAASTDLLAAWSRTLRAVAALDLQAAPRVVHDAIGLTPRQLEAVTGAGVQIPPETAEITEITEITEISEISEIVEAVWPPTPVQRGMIFHAAIGAEGSSAPGATDPYTSVLDVGLAGALDPSALRMAVEEVLAAHPQLRMRVRWVPGDGAPGAAEPVLVTVAGTDSGWRVVDLTGAAVPADLQSRDSPGSAADAASANAADLLDDSRDPDRGVAALVERELRRGYDLARDPLVRVTLVRIGDAEHRLVIANHHLILDGWSMPLLLDEVLRRYAALRDGAPTHPRPSTSGPLAPARSPFARHVARVRSAMQTGADAALSRRRALLATTQAGPVTTAVPGEPFADDQGTLLATRAGIAAVAHRHGTTESAIVATAWGAVLAALTGHDEAVTGTVVSGRDPEADADLLGMFTDTVPVLARFGAGRTVADAVGDLAGQIAATLVEPPVGLARLATALRRGHLFDTLLVVENYPGGDTDATAAAAGLRVTRLDGGDATHYPLSLTVETDADRTELRLEHDRASVPGDVAAAALHALGLVLDRLLVADPAEPASGLVDVAARAVPVDGLRSRGDSGGAATPAGESKAHAGTHEPEPTADPNGLIGPNEPIGPNEQATPTDADVEELVAVFRDLFATPARQPTALGSTPADQDGLTVDAEANFFALGGDSILAMALVTACRARGIRIRAGDIFTAPTPRALAVRASFGPADSAEAVPAGPAAPTNSPTLTATLRSTPAHAAESLISLDDAGTAALDDLLRNL